MEGVADGDRVDDRRRVEIGGAAVWIELRDLPHQLVTLDSWPPLRQTTRQLGDMECFNRPRVEAADDDRQRLAPTDADSRPTAELIGGELGRHGRDGAQAVVALPLQLGNQHAAETELARQVARQSRHWRGAGRRSRCGRFLHRVRVSGSARSSTGRGSSRGRFRSGCCRAGNGGSRRRSADRASGPRTAKPVCRARALASLGSLDPLLFGHCASAPPLSPVLAGGARSCSSMARHERWATVIGVSSACTR